MVHQPKCYELVAVNSLPAVGITKSIKSVVITKSALPRFNWLLRKLNRPALLGYTLSFPATVTFLFLDESISKWVAIAIVMLHLPLMLLSAMSLRVNMLMCLLKTYKFWLFFILSVTVVLLGIYLGGMRAMVAFAYWVSFQMTLCVETNLQVRQVVDSSFGDIVYQAFYMITNALNLTSDARNAIAFTYQQRTATISDALLSSAGTLAVPMLQTAYRKRQHLKRIFTNSDIVRCVNYRCRVKLQKRDDGYKTLSAHESVVNKVRAAASMATVQQFRCVTQAPCLTKMTLSVLECLTYCGIQRTGDCDWGGLHCMV